MSLGPVCLQRGCGSSQADVLRGDALSPCARPASRRGRRASPPPPGPAAGRGGAGAAPLPPAPGAPAPCSPRPLQPWPPLPRQPAAGPRPPPRPPLPALLQLAVEPRRDRAGEEDSEARGVLRRDDEEPSLARRMPAAKACSSIWLRSSSMCAAGVSCPGRTPAVGAGAAAAPSSSADRRGDAATKARSSQRRSAASFSRRTACCCWEGRLLLPFLGAAARSSQAACRAPGGRERD